MFCKYCGKEIEDGSTFCPYCGQRLDEEVKEKPVVEEKKEPVVEEKPIEKKVEPQKQVVEEKPVEKPKKEPKKQEPKEGSKVSKKQLIIYGAVGVVVIAAIVIVCLTIFGKKSIDPFEHMEPQYSGYNGYGRIDIEIEKAAEYMAESKYYDDCRGGFRLLSLRAERDLLRQDYEDASGDEKYEKSKNLTSFIDAIESMSINFDFNKKENGKLANGDVVVMTLDYDKDLLENEAGYKLKQTTIEYVVEGLKELNPVDLFANVEVAWTSDYGDYYITLLENEAMPLNYGCYEIGEVNNGIVTVSVNQDAIANDYGLKAADGKYSKEFTVGSQPAEVREVTGENYDQLVNLATKVLNEVYIDKCGWNLYNKDNIELITEKELTNIRSYWGEIVATFNVSTDAGGTYEKEISFTAMIDSNGNYQYSVNVDKERLGCTIERGRWKQN